MSETPKTAKAVTVPAVTLRRMISAVLPHAGTDDTLPVLNGVRFEFRDGTLFVSATDRYTLGVARYKVPGADAGEPDSPSVLLRRRDARMLRRMLREDEHPVVAVIMLGDRSLSAESGSFKGHWTAGKHTGNGPDLRAVLHRALAGTEVPLGEDRGIGAANLERISSPAEDGISEPLQVRIMRPLGRDGEERAASSSPMVLFARGDWFLGAVMPVTSGGSDRGSSWAEWAAVTAPAEKTADEQLAGSEAVSA